jgi:hypothetical protein
VRESPDSAPISATTNAGTCSSVMPKNSKTLASVVGTETKIALPLNCLAISVRRASAGVWLAASLSVKRSACCCIEDLKIFLAASCDMIGYEGLDAECHTFSINFSCLVHDNKATRVLRISPLIRYHY